MREVAVVGVGMTRFGQYPDQPYVEHGVEATRSALDDAGLEWNDIQYMYCGAANVGMTPGNRVAAELGATGIPVVNVENASASGSSAFREAYFAVADERCDIAIAVGVGKMGRIGGGGGGSQNERLAARATGPSPPVAAFAMRAQRWMAKYGTDPRVFAQVAVKNHYHGSLNPYAQFQDVFTLEEVLASRVIAEPLHMLECCPTGDGGAAAIVATPAVAARLGRHQVVRVTASAFAGIRHQDDPPMTVTASQDAYEQAGIGPGDLDMVQLHDAFSIEELEYYAELGICEPDEAERLVIDGDTALGGRIPFNTDGGLISRGHPLGPTGLAQVWETTLQLRGDAGPRQIEGASNGLLQMIGAGGVCLVHILQR
ncbi:MAG TPA: thiolase family protein [Dehalococcoidia bacterium]|nr:thiolase family protein [Dehalococcoidia bacterium]